MIRLVVLLLGLAGQAWAVTDNKQQELGELRGRIAQLREEVERASEDRKEAADDLRESEKRISEVNRALHDLNQDERKIGLTLRQLADEQTSVEARLKNQQQQLAELLRQRYRQGEPDSLRLTMSGRNPGEIQRDLGYFAYIGRARSALIEEHRQTLDELAAIADKTQSKQHALDQVKQTQLEQRSKLRTEQQVRQAVYTKLSNQIQQQRKEINSLVRDEQRLARLIEKLRRLAEEAKAKKEKAAREREQERPRAAQRGEKVDRVADASLAGFNFAALRGKLALPTAGEILAKFGQARSGGGPAWKGLFIKTRAGQQIRSVGSGEVVFSDWLRGFGNLLIVDHGDGYHSLSRHNESLYKQAGDTVRAGDVVAAAGNTGGHEATGLYFELRRQGQPFDPLSWVK